jgi:transposase InsO family protein
MHRWKAASALLKTELVHQACDPSRDAARQDLFVYIEGYYNRQRLHSALGYITPEQQGIANFQPALTSTGAMVSK